MASSLLRPRTARYQRRTKWPHPIRSCWVARLPVPPHSVFVGNSAAPGGDLIVDESDAGLVTIACTGTGKGVSQLIPTALTYPGSMVIMDVKGEIAAVTARARRALGQEVVILDPFGAKSDAFNPM